MKKLFIISLLLFAIPLYAKYDVAIVGAGVSGCYCSWRLSDQSEDVALFEMSDRIGGRLYSVKLPGMPNLVAELGGMRFLLSHKLVNGLVHFLELPTFPFYYYDENNLLFLRNCHLRFKDLQNPQKVPYNLSFQEEGKTPNELLLYAFKLILPELGDLTSDTHEMTTHELEIDGRKLYDYGYWNLLETVLSREAYKLINDASGYSLTYKNWNAILAIDTYLSAFTSHQYLGITTGFQQLPIELAKRSREKGVDLFLNQHLVTIERGTRTYPLKLIFETPEGNETVLVKKLILAIPGCALDYLAKNSPEIFQKKEIFNAIESVSPLPGSKIFLGYSYPWWKAIGLSKGRSVTDLEIRQTFYFGTVSDLPGGEPENHNALLLASYHDGFVEDFFEPLWDGPPFLGQKNAFVKDGEDLIPSGLGKRLTQDVIDQVQSQLKQVHGLKYIPQPYTGAYQDWGVYPYGGSSYRWNDNVDVVSMLIEMRHPMNDIPIYICGESYSDMQGWVEGALKSAELLLEEYFNLPRPKWLSEEYHLGPTRL